MKKIIIIILLMIFGFLNIYSETIKIVAFNYTGIMFEDKEDHSVKGYLIEMVREAYRSQGIDVDFVFYPSKRAKFSFMKNEFLAAAGSSIQYQKEKEENIVETVDFAMSEFSFYYDKTENENIEYEDILRGKYLVGTILGSSTLNFFKKKGIPYETSPELKNVVGKLIRNRVDVIIGGEYSVNYILKEYYGEYYKRISKVKTSYSTLPVSVMFNKKSSESMKYKEIFEKGLYKIKENGIYEKILKKYKFNGKSL